jgi:hypothetical protein
LARVVEERIMPEVSLYGFCPRAGLGAGPSLLSQNDEDSCRGAAERARGKQPKTPNRMLAAFRDVLSPTVNELFQRALHLNPAMQFFVFEPKFDGSFSDEGDSTLRDGWPLHIATGVFQEMRFVLERLNLDYPRAFFLVSEQRFHLANGHRHTKLLRLQGCTEKIYHCLPAHLASYLRTLNRERRP